MRIDIHQHHWSEPFLLALSRRKDPPYARVERGEWVVTAAGEADTRLTSADLDLSLRREQMARNHVDVGVIAPSSPIGFEDLVDSESRQLIEAYIAGAATLPTDWRFWGATSTRRPQLDLIDTQLDMGAVGIAVPAGAIAAPEGFAALHDVFTRVEQRGSAIFVHPGQGPFSSLAIGTPEQAWWPALTRYVAEMNAAWHAFLAVGRSLHPNVRVVFAMLAGLAPLHVDRLEVRGGPSALVRDPLVYYDTSSYGRLAVEAVAKVVGTSQLVYGSDAPVAQIAAVPSGVAEEDVLENNPLRLLEAGVTS